MRAMNKLGLVKSNLAVLILAAVLSAAAPSWSADIPDDTVMVSTGNGRVTVHRGRSAYWTTEHDDRIAVYNGFRI